MTFDNLGRFVIENYPSQKPFSSFLPGIAGVLGVPMWVFYTNRGQGIAGFGVEDKDSPIMEFQPANKAYQTTPYTGFRTFLKIDGDYYEPFSPNATTAPVNRDMYIGMNEVEIQDINTERGIQTNVLYYTLTNEPLAGLVRRVTLKNISDKPMTIDVLDGMAAIAPYGTSNWFLKMMARTGEAWLEVFNMDRDVPFYRTRASIVDKSEVEGVEAGNFYISFVDNDNQAELLSPIVDPSIIFGANTSLSQPDEFIAQDVESLLHQRQVTVGKTPCGFVGTSIELAPNQSVQIFSVIGHANNLEALNDYTPTVVDSGYIQQQLVDSRTLAQTLTDKVSIKTSSSVLDAYTRQTFLDNVMRGGWPLVLDGDIVYHVYSRKHGDMERDYNAFFLSAEPYSQGNGNFRDVNQNRREDVWLNPDVGDFNIRMFMNLIQADGYNPLVIHGSKLRLTDDGLQQVLQLVDDRDQFDSFPFDSFSPGELLTYMAVNHVQLKVSQDEFLAVIFEHASQHIETSFDEGYWVDHWTYNLDLVENYLAIYPDQEADLLFNQRVFTFHDSDAIVRPRHEKHVLANGEPRQFNSVKHDEEKIALIASREELPHVVRTQYGQGEIYYSTLIAKLFTLAVVKFSQLDPYGFGIEMEADKPGWYDAINGLPGLFGSSMPETFELLRLIEFMRDHIADHNDVSIQLPVEVAALLDVIAAESDYWLVVAAREAYREHVRLGFDGAEETLSHHDLMAIIDTLRDKLIDGIQRAIDLNDGIPPTYFRYHPTDYDVLDTTDEQGRSHIRVHAYDVEVLPLFLEGAVRCMKVASKDRAKLIYHKVRQSELYDTKLKMYRLNGSLDEQPMDIGRCRAFTSGWLENGSIWMHMAYKYLLALLQAELYDEFFTEFNDGLIAFQDPKVYGRSILENSSFIASSTHPDESIHGQGFVARLSGSTAEYLSILHQMMIGKQPFYLENDELKLQFKPVLTEDLFDDDHQVQFTFLGGCQITYHNPKRQATYELEPTSIVITTDDGEIEIEGSSIGEPYSSRVRSGEITQIDVHF